MNRRDTLLALLVLGAASRPSGVRAQQAAMPVVGYLSSGTTAGFTRLVAALRRG